jgi:UPF0755 protein
MAVYKFIQEKKFPIFFHITALLILCSFFFISDLKTPLDNQNRPITVAIPKGSNFSKIMDILGEEHLIGNRLAFYAFARLKDAPRNIRAGEYELSSSMPPTLIIDKLIRGEVKGYRIPLPEGQTYRQIASTLAAQGLIKEKKFLQLCTDRDFIASLNIESASLEGYLFPDTYILTKSMDEKEIITLMVNQFRKKVTPEIIMRAGELGWNLHQLLTMASLIEKEAGIKEEKPLVSAVFYNRLKKSMRLQSDPTAVYGLDNFMGPITRDHLSINSPYNTYRISGLPPGPIANPGMDSIRAVLDPAPVDYLYFVSRNDGSHQFSSTLALHNQAVREFRSKREED